MTFTRAIAAFIAAIYMYMAVPAYAQISQEEHQARLKLAQSMKNMTLSILMDQKKQNTADREQVLMQGFTKSVDIDWIAKFVLGNAWRHASAEQRERYVDLYRTYITNVYISTYAQSSDRKIRDIKVVSINDNDADDRRFTTRTELLLANSDSVKVDYLAEARDNGKYKIIDVVIEGVSLLNSHRAQFAKIATTHGVDGVITKLEQLTNPTT